MVEETEETEVKTREQPRVKHHRDLVEALTWRGVALATEFTVAYLILGNITVSAEISLVTSVLLIVFYILHRKMWRRIKWGYH